MLKKSLLSVSCALAFGAVALPAVASSFYLVVPIPVAEKVTEPEELITVSLAGAELPDGQRNKAYSESLQSYLSVTGDPKFDPASASWSLVDGALPAGLSLDSATGIVSGTPTAKTNADFSVVASYKGESGQAVYTIKVGEVYLEVVWISAGDGYTCAVTTSGAAKCWGYGGSGKLGNNSTVNSLVPVGVVGLDSGISNISAADIHTCVVTTSGAAKCWGSGSNGKLGNNSVDNQSAPVDVVGLGSGVATISAGTRYTCASTTSGAVKCWGYGSNGQLGNNSTSESRVPIDVIGLSFGTASISAGSTHTCAVTTSGAAKCWGQGYEGRLGNNSTVQSSVPVDVLSD